MIIPPSDHRRRRLACASLAALLGLTSLAAACGGQTVDTGAEGASSLTTAPGSTATPSTAKVAKTPKQSSTTATAGASSSSSTSKVTNSSTTTTGKASSTTGAAAGTWPKAGDDDLTPPTGYSYLGGGSISDSLVYSLFSTPGGGHVATIGQTTLDSKGRVGTRTVKAVLVLPALGAGEALASGCSGPNSSGPYYIGIGNSGGAGDFGTYHPTKAWLANAGSLSFTVADPTTVECHTGGN